LRRFEGKLPSMGLAGTWQEWRNQEWRNKAFAPYVCSKWWSIGGGLFGALSGGLCRTIACRLLIAGGGPYDGAYDNQRGQDGGGDNAGIPGPLIDIAIWDLL
jgi:hypothetical protein